MLASLRLSDSLRISKLSCVPGFDYDNKIVRGKLFLCVGDDLPIVDFTNKFRPASPPPVNSLDL